MRFRVTCIAPLVLLAVALVGCGQATEAPEPAQAPLSGEVLVEMRDLAYRPAEVTVTAGTAVSWANRDGFPHTVVSGTRGSPSGLFSSGEIQGGNVFSYTFEEPGTYDYYCSIHAGMSGVVHVVQP